MTDVAGKGWRAELLTWGWSTTSNAIRSSGRRPRSRRRTGARRCRALRRCSEFRSARLVKARRGSSGSLSLILDRIQAVYPTQTIKGAYCSKNRNSPCARSTSALVVVGNRLAVADGQSAPEYRSRDSHPRRPRLPGRRSAARESGAARRRNLARKPLRRCPSILSAQVLTRVNLSRITLAPGVGRGRHAELRTASPDGLVVVVAVVRQRVDPLICDPLRPRIRAPTPESITALSPSSSRVSSSASASSGVNMGMAAYQAIAKAGVDLR